ncbi:rnc [Wigglesworthia glossinidia endosymbiont of Glossina brevipalpis]|uniref:Ribonuclease 3 n=1 Tax=Wigglesworthia glossinidia brevipalpis TaxID=36870 RepID=RNC_WIGBR|nr:RecName: Full=Ribonuclease 3; AltName: Full=Ribonuclease III; Short=RNase III [Wigglesworthia glossinidia endosymbiont of Glossina brevipalpis]BAC24342.1 rnc [Wigglesworthia glossinidia endosymbiont of Glossina brevipalpis]
MKNLFFNKLQKKMGYLFHNNIILKQALTHRSFSSKNNERLEFLGDSILNYIISDALYNNFTNIPEGKLSQMRSYLVRGNTLAEIAREFCLGDYLILGIGEVKTGGKNRDSILSNAMEAIIGGIFLDSNINKTHEIVISWYKNRLYSMSLKNLKKDPKTRLQEYLQGNKFSLPQYYIKNITGESHNQEFTICCFIDDLKKSVIGYGKTRRKAEQSAAKQALLLFNIL